MENINGYAIPFDDSKGITRNAFGDSRAIKRMYKGSKEQQNKFENYKPKSILDYVEPLVREETALCNNSNRKVRLSDERVRELRSAKGTVNELSKKFGVSTSTVRNIQQGLRRKDV